MASTGRSFRRIVGLAVAVGLAVPCAGWAQSGRSAAGKTAVKVETEIEEITVTAQKREENIQEIPVSVTALGSATLEQKGVANVAQLGETTPNLRVVSNIGSSSSTTIAIRGLAQGAVDTAMQPPAGLYVDGVYLAKNRGTNLDLEDIERVEVLRGPQGTLYGRNTIAGAINFVTKKPTDERSIKVATEVGNYDRFVGRMTLNVPLVGQNGFVQSDALGTLSLRQNVAYKTRDGFYRNTAPAAMGKEFDDLNRIFTMTSLRWQPSDALTVDYSGEYHRFRNGTSQFQVSYIYPGGPVDGGFFNLQPYLRPNRVDSIALNPLCQTNMKCDTRPADDGNHRMHVLTGTYELGDLGPLGRATLKSISSYRHFNARQDSPFSGAPVQVTDISIHDDVEHWTQEFQVVGTAPRVRYVLGAYYYGEYSKQKWTQVFFQGGLNLPFRTRINVESYAPYGQFTYTPPILDDRLSVTGGIRYTQEQVHVFHRSECVAVVVMTEFGPMNLCNNPFVPVPSLQTWEEQKGKSFGGGDGISPMGDISYQWTDELMTYFRVARGFKSGAFNTTSSDPFAFAPFQPEKLLQFEVGFKSQWFDNRLRINADGFYSDYSDLQVSVFRPSTTGGLASVITNAASAEIWGSELEVTAVPWRGLEITGNYGLMLPTYTEWLDQKFDADNQPVFDANGDPVFEDVSKQRAFAQTPEHQFTLGFTYTAPPTSTGVFSVHADVFWQDKVAHIANNNTPGAQAMESANYALVNGRLQFTGIPLQKGTLDVAVFAHNLFDKKYRTYGMDLGTAIGYSGNIYGPPRTFGLALIYNFTAS